MCREHYPLQQSYLHLLRNKFAQTSSYQYFNISFDCQQILSAGAQHHMCKPVEGIRTFYTQVNSVFKSSAF